MTIKKRLTIAIDAMSGDFGLAVTIPSALTILERFGDITVILVGDTTAIESYLNPLPIHAQSRCFVQDTSYFKPTDKALWDSAHSPSDTAAYVTVDLVKQKLAHACVSAGSSAILLSAAKAYLDPLPAIDLPALSIVVPTLQPHQRVRLLDLGANIHPTPQHLLQYALIGCALSQTIDQVDLPAVGLLNTYPNADLNNHLLQRTHRLFLEHTTLLNYCGYVTINELFDGKADTIVTDALTGHTAYSVVEGGIKTLHTYLQNSFSNGGLSTLARSMLQPFFKKIEAQLDKNAYNGASLLGLDGTVIKSHEKATQQAFCHAIQKAIVEAEKEIPQRIRSLFSTLHLPD